MRRPPRGWFTAHVFEIQASAVVKVSRNAPERRPGAPEKPKKASRGPQKPKKGPQNVRIFTGTLDSSPFRGPNALNITLHRTRIHFLKYVTEIRVGPRNKARGPWHLYSSWAPKFIRPQCVVGMRLSFNFVNV